MRIEVVSELDGVASGVTEQLREAGFAVEQVERETEKFELCVGKQVRIDEISAVLQALKPLLPSVRMVEDRDDDVIEFACGADALLSQYNVKIYCDSNEFSALLRRDINELGFSDSGGQVSRQDVNILKYGGATPAVRQMLRWVLARHRIRVTEEKAWGSDDNDIWLYLRDPRFDGRSLKESVGVEIYGDDLAATMALQGHLREQGYRNCSVRLLDPETRPRFLLEPGSFGRDEGEQLALSSAIWGFLQARGVDPSRHPLKVEDADPAMPTRVLLPLGAWASGALRPTSGEWKERWPITVRTDDEAAAQPLVDALHGLGFTGVRTEGLPSASVGFALRWGAVVAVPAVADVIRGALERAIGALGGSSAVPLAVVEAARDDDAVTIDLPTREIDDEGLLRRLEAAASRWEFKLRAERLEDYDLLVPRLRAMRWQQFETETASSVSEAQVQYGGAPAALAEHVASLVHRTVGVRCAVRKAWDDDDTSIWLSLPERHTVDNEAPPQGVDLSAWFARGPRALGQRGLVEVGASVVRVGDVELPRRTGAPHPLAPAPRLFDHYCLDQRTAETLLHVAEAVALGEPCLLEGETSVSKTSIVQYLASLLQQPVVRLNLNGQTDAGELIGRFLPQGSPEALPLSLDELAESAELLQPMTQQILRQARADARPLTRVEVQQVMARERITQHPWRWQDGLIVSAMRLGWWVVLDELNLAEPQILERLNSVLERDPSLVLTEHDNEVLGPGGTPIHPSFRIFATMNPAEYAGRSALSPAYRDRWRGYVFVHPPGEAEYAAMLRALVHGSRPDVQIRGASFRGQPGEAPMAGLADVPGIDAFLQALARFHTALEGAVGRGGNRGGGLGARRKERYVFTRRGLLSVLDYIAHAVVVQGQAPTWAMRVALARTYVGRVGNVADQQVVLQLLDAAGIGPNTWRVDSQPGQGGR